LTLIALTVPASAADRCYTANGKRVRYVDAPVAPRYETPPVVQSLKSAPAPSVPEPSSETPPVAQSRKPLPTPSAPASLLQGPMTAAERERISELCRTFQKVIKQSGSDKCYSVPGLLPGVDNCAVVALSIERCTLAGWDMTP
jgi:hypothetical protein